MPVKQTKAKTTADVMETTTPVVSTSTPVVVEKMVKSKKVVKTETAPVAPIVIPTLSTPFVSSPATPSVSSPASSLMCENVVTSLSMDTTDADVEIQTLSTDFVSKLNQLSSIIATIKAEYKTLEKKFTKELKTAQKVNSKRKRKSGNRAPSGFVKPTRISDELAGFLEKSVGTEMARTDVTREINKYIRAHNLQDKENGRKINPDDKLSSLLKLKKTDELTYFNLQRYMSPHFHKTSKDVVASATV